MFRNFHAMKVLKGSIFADIIYAAAAAAKQNAFTLLCFFDGSFSSSLPTLLDTLVYFDSFSGALSHTPSPFTQNKGAGGASALRLNTLKEFAVPNECHPGDLCAMDVGWKPLCLRRRPGHGQARPGAPRDPLFSPMAGPENVCAHYFF